MLSWLITVENQEGQTIFADTFNASGVYIITLLRLCRLTDDRLPNGVVKVLCPHVKGVVGQREWERDAKWLEFRGLKLKELAEVARKTGLNMESD